MKSKNQKKRARKKLKKAEEGGASSDVAVGDGEEEGGSRDEGRGGAGEKVVVDPVAELKRRLIEAKASQVLRHSYNIHTHSHCMGVYTPYIVHRRPECVCVSVCV